MLRTVKEMLSCWKAGRSRRKCRAWNVVPLALMWIVWGERNRRAFEGLSRVARITEANFEVDEGKDGVEREHNLYAFLLRELEISSSCPRSDCIRYAVSDPSRDDDVLMGNICNTLDPRDRFQNMPFYWSGIGHSDPNAPEMLIYELRSDLCVITEINIQPFKGDCSGKPIYSAKSVRFRLGHLNSSRDESDLLQLSQQQPVDDEFIWMYTSEEFPTRQGRISNVKAMGLPIYDFGVQNLKPSGDFELEYTD
ncbi:hypothetical protein FXO38_26312 [Capsicum annuum]|nr:hypothetical protein FXO38_26312 [Capsicum annuum]